jgi:hypothetical protein
LSGNTPLHNHHPARILVRRYLVVIGVGLIASFAAASSARQRVDDPGGEQADAEARIWSLTARSQLNRAVSPPPARALLVAR